MHGREFGPKNYYCPEGFADGDWRKGHAEFNGLQPLSSVGSHNYSRDAKKYMTNSVIIFGELALFLGHGNIYQEHQILLMKDKREAKFIT